jgi:hypothetical protein
MPLNQQDKDELAALGIFGEVPPDDWVYQQGTTFVVSNSPRPSSATPNSPDQPPEGFVAPESPPKAQPDSDSTLAVPSPEASPAT